MAQWRGADTPVAICLPAFLAVARVRRDGSTVKCTYCGEQVVGRHTLWEDGKVGCRTCVQVYPRCEGCGQLVLGDGPLCTECDGKVQRCGVCEAPLHRHFQRSPDLGFLCLRCAGRLPRCAACSGPFQNGVQWLGRTYCKQCYESAEKCVLCDDVAVGTRWQLETLGVVCQKCHRDAPRCRRCNLPTRDGRRVSTSEGEQLLCTACFEQVPWCQSCGGALTGKHVFHPSHPERLFCEPCAGGSHRCDFCGCMLTGDDKVHPYPDGRLSCLACRKTAVDSQNKLDELVTEARSWLERSWGMRLRDAEQCPVKLAQPAEIKALRGSSFRATPGFEVRERGLFSASIVERREGSRVVGVDEDMSIHIESGLPEVEAFGTVVHEHVHLWQLDNLPARRWGERRLVEGLACWFQLQALLHRGADQEADCLRANPDPIYGDGLRMVVDLARRVGHANLLTEIRSKAKRG